MRISLARHNFFYLILIVSLLVSCTTEEAEFTKEEINKWVQYTRSDGLAGNLAKVIYEDSDGNIWIGSENSGVTRYDGESFTVYNTGSGLISNNILAITEDKVNNEIWFGNDRGLSIMDENMDWYYLDELDGTPFYITSLYTDTDNRIWIGTQPFGLLSFDNTNGLQQYYDNSCNECNYINTIYQTSDGTLWFGTDGGLRRRSGSQFIVYNVSDGLPWNSVTALMEDSWGSLWVGTFAGKDIVYRKDNQFNTVSLYNGYDVNVIFGLAEESSGKIWFGSYNHGLMYYDGAVTRTLPPDSQPGQVQVYSMYKDSKGIIWVGTAEQGLWKYISP